MQHKKNGKSHRQRGSPLPPFIKALVGKKWLHYKFCIGTSNTKIQVKWCLYILRVKIQRLPSSKFYEVLSCTASLCTNFSKSVLSRPFLQGHNTHPSFRRQRRQDIISGFMLVTDLHYFVKYPHQMAAAVSKSHLTVQKAMKLSSLSEASQKH